MLSIIDKYILKRYLATFFVMLLLFTPIGIVIDVSEKINKMLANDVPFKQIAFYYFNFTIYFANLLFPIFLFLSIIWFTSKMANNTEIIAILSSGISFSRFLRPYLIGATLISLFSLAMGFYIVPKASANYNNFRSTYLSAGGINEARVNTNVFRQINKNEFIYVSHFNTVSKVAFNFSLEKFKGDKLDFKITANRLQWMPKDSTYRLYNYTKRTVGPLNDKLEHLEQKDTVFKFDLDDLTPVDYIAETMVVTKLGNFIDKERARGSSNIATYQAVLYKKFTSPISAFILTIIAVAVAAMKRRGGMGKNLAIGIVVAFTFVFFDKIFGVMAEKSSIPTMLAIWIPNILFGILAFYLLKNAKK